MSNGVRIYRPISCRSGLFYSPLVGLNEGAEVGMGVGTVMIKESTGQTVGSCCHGLLRYQTILATQNVADVLYYYTLLLTCCWIIRRIPSGSQSFGFLRGGGGPTPRGYKRCRLGRRWTSTSTHRRCGLLSWDGCWD